MTFNDFGKRKYWGWGLTGEGVPEQQRERVRRLLTSTFGVTPGELPPPVSPDQAELARSRLTLPGQDWYSSDPHQRLLHGAGKSYLDVLNMRHGRFNHLPDVVAFPGNLEQLASTMEWADQVNAAIIPFGGGTSVTGGVNPVVSSRFDGTVTINLGRLDKVLDIDTTSRHAYVEAGILAPALDAALRQQGLSIRHYPQSYYFSTVGGWIATRSGGHYSTLLGKIDDRVASLQVMAPDGTVSESRTLPAGSVGPDPNRLWIGSEGSLGIITRARVRIVRQPTHKSTSSLHFPDFESGLDAARAIVQSGLYPAHLRVLDPFEAMMSAGISGSGGAVGATMILGFESADFPVDEQHARAQKIATEFGGKARTAAGSSNSDESVDGWRDTFFKQPYLRDLMIEWGVIAETFETAIPWREAHQFYRDVRDDVMNVLQSQCGGGGVLCRTTHAYPDGVAFYFSFFAPARRGAEHEQYAVIKTAATDAVIKYGGTASHHHACGRDHAPWAHKELPELWYRAWKGARHALDPAGRMNPGVIFPEQ